MTTRAVMLSHEGLESGRWVVGVGRLVERNISLNPARSPEKRDRAACLSGSKQMQALPEFIASSLLLSSLPQTVLCLTTSPEQGGHGLIQGKMNCQKDKTKSEIWWKSSSSSAFHR